MGKKIPIILDTIEFDTKTEAKRFFSNMLHRYNRGDIVSNEDAIHLRSLVKRHPEDKVLSEIKYFFVEKSNEHPTNCFHIKRINNDGKTDFSIGTCIDAKEPTLKERFYRACESSISNSRITEKNRQLDEGQINEKTGEPFTKEDSTCRHTQPTFTEIIEEFINEHSIELSLDLIVKNQDMQYGTEFADSNLSKLFAEFHKKRAVFRLFPK